jgi:hypothetical protein
LAYYEEPGEPNKMPLQPASEVAWIQRYGNDPLISVSAEQLIAEDDISLFKSNHIDE